QHRSLPLHLVFPNGNVLAQLALDLRDEGLAYAAGDVGASELLDLEGEAHVDVLSVDGRHRVDEQRLHDPAETHGGEAKAVRQALYGAVYLAAGSFHARVGEHAH